MSKSLYKTYAKMNAWGVLEKAFEELSKNGDIEEFTDRKYIVGYLIKKLVEGNILNNQGYFIKKKSRT